MKSNLEQTEIEAPYELPEGWKWMQQNEVCKLTDGEKRTGTEFPYLEVKYLRGKKEKDFVSTGKFIKAGTKVILVDGENSGEVFTVPEDGFMGSTFKAIEISNVNENALAPCLNAVLTISQKLQIFCLVNTMEQVKSIPDLETFSIAFIWLQKQFTPVESTHP